MKQGEIKPDKVEDFYKLLELEKRWQNRIVDDLIQAKQNLQKLIDKQSN